MAYQLTKDLETGNSLIDSEHRQLIQAINNLLAACSQGQGRSELTRTANFLKDYTSKHFADEERLQQTHSYPDYPSHKRYHEEFKKLVSNLVQKLDAQGPTVALVAELNNVLASWLLNHIKQEDKKLAAFLKM